MKDNKKEVEMALLEQLCHLLDASAMTAYKQPAQKTEPDENENQETVGEAGDGKAIEPNPGMTYDDDPEDNEDEVISKLRKLAAKKSKEY